MEIAGIEFPDSLLEDLRNNKLVIFAGAGVSMGPPANLPDFDGLAKSIAEGTDLEKGENESDDIFLGRLKRDNGVDVHERAKDILTQGNPLPTELHKNLLQLYHKVEKVRIVTTNFDLLFEDAADKVLRAKLKVFQAPVLLSKKEFNGIIHIHGAVSDPSEMVLTDIDFAQGYLRDRWATGFLFDMFHKYTVLFVGYSHEEIIMNYLSKALPENVEGKRFALTKQNDLSRWKSLGIEAIGYPETEGDCHRALHKAIQRLSYLNSDDISHWKLKVTKIAQKPPSLKKEDIEVIEYALKNEERACFFAKAARSPEWLEWLRNGNYLEKILGTGTPNKIDLILADWLAENFALQYANKLLLLISENGVNYEMRLRPFFWEALARKIAISRSEELDKNILSRWVPILLETIPKSSDLSYTDISYIIHILGKHCNYHEILESSLLIFSVMAKSRMQIKPFSLYEEENFNPRLEADLSLLSPDDYLLKSLWKETLKPHMTEESEPILRVIIARLEEFHFKLLNSQEPKCELDILNWRRSAIEPHEQDRSPGPIDVLIDAARDCLSNLAEHQSEAAARWCIQLVSSKALLLRRLAVHTLPQCTGLTSDEKIEWLLTNIGLHDIGTHHEIFLGVTSLYPEISLAKREKVIDALLNYHGPDQKNPYNGIYAAHHPLNWLPSLHNTVPNCTLTREVLENMQIQFPDFEPDEYPDMTHWIKRINLTSPWTVEELLAKPATHWIPKLQSPEPTEPSNFPDHYVRNLTVGKAAGKNPDWGFSLAKALAKKKKWNAGIWPFLIQAWAQIQLDKDNYRKVLQWLSNVELHSKCKLEIARLLRALAQNNDNFSLLPQANKIASALWLNLEMDESPKKHKDWPIQAINHPAGVLTEFWVKGLLIWRSQQKLVPKNFNTYYLQTFSSIVQNCKLPGIFARSILLGKLLFLLDADKAWTKKNLLPQFDVERPIADFQAAWAGFLTWGHLTPEVAKLLKEKFLQAAPHINGRLIHQKMQFITYYTHMICNYTSEPIKKCLPKIIRRESKETKGTKEIFASSIGSFLQGINEQRQKKLWEGWLRCYWKDRLQGVPALLEGEEIEYMLEWLPRLTAIFPEAVDLAVKMPRIYLKRHLVIYELKESNLWKKHPKAVAKLLIYLLKPKPIMMPGDWEFVNNLIQTDLPPELKKGLEEIIIRSGSSND